jgi:acyl-CoA synthetase (NDP forming)
MSNPLHSLLHPRSIAIAGASNNPMKMGTMQALSIINDGYQGRLYPIHPIEKTVLGLTAYPSVADLPEPPDLAMIVVPTQFVAPFLEDFGRIGTKGAIVISAGFKEMGKEGRAMEDRLNEIAGRYGMRFIGPNCMGFLNSQISLNVSVLRLEHRPGSLGLASQSGTYVTQTLNYLRKRGIWFSKAVSTGNEANITMTDVMEYLGEDEHTKTIILYIESIRDGRRFIEVARRITPHKPIVAQYVGGSAAGARAGMSHTGAMAGPDALYDGIFRQAGIIRVHSIEDLYAHGWTLATQPPLRGRRLGIVTHSGGPGTAIANMADREGLEVPLLSEVLQEQIRPFLPAQGIAANPVDLTFHRDVMVLSKTIPELLMKSDEVDGVIVHGPMGDGFMKEIYPHLRQLLQDVPMARYLEGSKMNFSESLAIPRKYNLPLLISSFFDRDDNFIAAYEDSGTPVFDSPEKAARAMAALLRHKEIRERKPYVAVVLPERADSADEIIMAALARGQGALNEHEAKQVLAAYGVPICQERLTYSEDEAVQAASTIGFPVVMKACSAEIMHKTGKGLIDLDVRTHRDVRHAFQSIRAAAVKEVPILVQQAVTGSREFVVGMTRFPGFGPAVLFGLGGVLTEAMRDSTFRVAPLGDVEAQEMLHEIRTKVLLGQFRGMPAVDVSALSHIIKIVSSIPFLHPAVSEIDLNPVIISGSAPVVVDALFLIA